MVVPMHNRVTGALFVVVALLMCNTVLGSRPDVGETSEFTCNKQTASNGISVSVDTQTKRAVFICDADMNSVLPSPSGDTITTFYTTENAREEMTLVELFGEKSKGTVMEAKAELSKSSTITLTLEKLPEMTATIYFICAAAANASDSNLVPEPPSVSVVTSPPTISAGHSTGTAVGSATESRRLMAVDSAPYEAPRRSVNRITKVNEAAPGSKCVVTVTVPADPAASTCTVEKENMELEINSESKRVSFLCDTGITTLIPLDPSNKILDESCQNEVTLADALPSAKFERTVEDYQFSVGELPETAVTLCYKCSAALDSEREQAAAEGSNACTVKIKVTAANHRSAAFPFATTGSVLAVVLGVAVSVSFLPLVL
uniref:SRS domain-containing protein n=1 Tax=Neospora caninum (strain Liverpool) TaxID=572307 RepID=F0JAX0_NEOCL|nr:SRS domain-containing protein [Neospora caninum Liverpool]CEL71236.1 TPA: SRS domain-containing protein [Neospora caninum Liverpool]